jgi:hypothetical protein
MMRGGAIHPAGFCMNKKEIIERWKRAGFHGHEAPESVSSRYLNKRVPDELRTHGNPIRYVGF